MIRPCLTMLAVCLAVASFSAALADEDPVDATKKSIAEIRSKGGHVMELAQTDSRLEVAYHLADGDVTDEHLVPLKSLTNVYQVNLRKTKITDAGLVHLAGLKSLVRLHLENTAVTDVGLKHLKGLENLEYLNLYGTKVSDAGLKELAGLKKLKKLYLWQTQVTDAGTAELQQALPELKIIRGLDAKKPEEKKEEKKPEEKQEEKKS